MIYPFSSLFNKTCHLAVFISEEGGLIIGFILCLFVDWPMIGGGGGGGGSYKWRRGAYKRHFGVLLNSPPPLGCFPSLLY